MRRFFSSECMRRGGVVLGFVSAAAGAGKRLLIGIRNNTRPRVSFQHGQGSRKCRGGQIRTLTNDLYPLQKLAAIEDPAKREEFLRAWAHGSAASWRQVNWWGEYDFSDDRLRDSVGIKPPRLID